MNVIMTMRMVNLEEKGTISRLGEMNGNDDNIKSCGCFENS